MNDGIAARVRVTRGAFTLDAEVAVAPGELVVLVGPNGAGKSTLLHAVAGLVGIDEGLITIDGEVVDEPARGVFAPASRRGVGVVFQDDLLFGHLDLAANVAFGLRARGVARREARRRAIEWLARVGLGGRERARPSELSGGQAQRVGLARALAFEPRAVVLDEPFAALDATTRVEVRRAVAAHLAALGVPKLLVTHDPVEALALADRIVVLEDGRVTQSGAPAEIRDRPRSRFVGDLLGINLLRGERRGAIVEIVGGGRVVVADDGRGADDGAVLVTIHPHAVALHAAAPAGSARNVWPVAVTDIDDARDRVRVALRAPFPLVAEITRDARRELGVERGAQLWASCKATEVVVQPD